MAVEASLPAIGTVLFTAAIDSINPCAIGVLVLMISAMLGAKSNRNKMLLIGVVYIAAVYITYFIAGVGLAYFFQYIPIYISEYVAIVIGTLIAGAGLIEIKDYFWYAKGFTLAIPAERAQQIKKYTKNLSIPGAMFLGAFVSAVELPCTGAPYLAIILVLAQDGGLNFTAYLLLALYNLVFVAPLLIILFLVYFGMNINVVNKWKQNNKPYMRLVAGLLLIFLSWLLILIAIGVINFG